MKILTVSPRPLYPIETGLELRIFNLLKPLCSRHQLSLICFKPEMEQDYVLDENLKALFSKVETVKLENNITKEKQGISKRFREYFSPTRVSLGNLCTSINMHKAMQSLLNTEEFDLIFIASPFMVNYVLPAGNIPVVFDAIDDTSLLFYREIKQQRNLLKKVKAVKDWLETRRVEKKFYSRFKEIVITSSVDAGVIGSLCPKSNVTVIPIGIDVQYFENVSRESEKPVIVFSGVMNYNPNILAMTYFCRSIFPIIAQKVPAVRLMIVGRNPNNEITRLGESIPGVEVTGGVEDIRQYMGQSKVYVCPLISGAGIKIKILEAWAAGIPIVATSLSCEGIDVTPGDDILVEDDINRFADAVVKLLSDENLARQLVRNGKEKVSKYYNLETMAIRLNEVFVRAVNNYGT